MQEVLCFEFGKPSPRQFLNRDNAIKSSSLQCEYGYENTTQEQSNTFLDGRTHHFSARRMVDAFQYEENVDSRLLIDIHRIVRYEFVAKGETVN